MEPTSRFVLVQMNLLQKTQLTLYEDAFRFTDILYLEFRLEMS